MLVLQTPDEKGSDYSVLLQNVVKFDTDTFKTETFATCVRIYSLDKNSDYGYVFSYGIGSSYEFGITIGKNVLYLLAANTPIVFKVSNSYYSLLYYKLITIINPSRTHTVKYPYVCKCMESG